MDNEPTKARVAWADFKQLVPEADKALLSISAAVQASGMNPRLLELVKLRASQMNGCAFCVAMHANKLRQDGESAARLDLLPVWREANVFSAAERAALAWTEAVTALWPEHVSDDAYAEASAAFSDVELATLTTAVVLINAWNRIAVAYRFVPGSAPLKHQTPSRHGRDLK